MTEASLANEARSFRQMKSCEQAHAAQIAAFRLATGIDLEEALSTDGSKREAMMRRLSRLLERERLRGGRRHWSYDLNRHIALKQVLDQLRGHSPARPCP